MSKWIEEELEPGLRASYGLKKVLNSCQSKWQSVDVVDLECFGKALMIDGLIQVRDKREPDVRFAGLRPTDLAATVNWKLAEPPRAYTRSRARWTSTSTTSRSCTRRSCRTRAQRRCTSAAVAKARLRARFCATLRWRSA